MNLSYWERKTWFTNVDYTVVGSGIVGLHTALRLSERFPESKILVLEKGMLPEGASTKNAGFACFGSVSEIIDDLNCHTEEEVFKLIEKRWQGLQLLRKNLGDQAIDLQNHGGYEVFLNEDVTSFEACSHYLPLINSLLKPLFKTDVYTLKPNKFGFKKVMDNVIFNTFEAQIDTGRMMQSLLKKVTSKNVLILNNQKVIEYREEKEGVKVYLEDFSFSTKKLLFATNGFAEKLTNERVTPARAQVLITKPIKNLDLKGTFHLDKGYYYFRNIDNRILIGGGRNLDFIGETTTMLGQTEIIQNRLESLLKEVILPHHHIEIDYSWSGIMGMGKSKNPIVEQLSTHVFCGVRLGGMGVAIGSLVGTALADLVNGSS
jgi:glycine/D-amino acid oxidase-like deaminating enzyme